MSFFNRLVAVMLAAALAAPMAPLEAKSKKGDRYLAEGRAHEEKKEWDAALQSYEKALSEDPAELVYQMAAQKARFQAAQMHIDKGLKIRAQGLLGEALIELQKGYAINPGSAIAEQEIIRTQQMIQREQKRVEQTGHEAPPEVKALTPVEEFKRESEERMHRMQAAPELKPPHPVLPDMTISAQPIKTVFETVGKVAEIAVLWDPEYQSPGQQRTLTVHFPEKTTVEEALDYLCTITKSYWKPLSANTIFITNDNPNKRRDFAEMVAQTFYLQNVSLPQEIQEIVNAVRSVSELQRVVAYNAQNAIIVRGEADQVALAGKMIHDLDKPRPEVVVDLMVIEASSDMSRQLTAALASTGLNVPVTFTPRPSIQVQQSSSSSNNGSTDNSNSSSSTTVTTTPAASTTGSAIPLSQLGHLSSADFAISLPSALLQAVLSDTKTRTLQAPQIRTLDGVKAEIKIGEREPTATGSFQPGIGGVGINPLVNTQFTYIDVGVNVALQTRVHDNGDVYMHIDLDVSTVAGHINLGGIDQPIIGQRKISQDIRMHQGEVGLLGGLINTQDTKQVTGIPGLNSIPLLRRLFSGESTDHQRGELMIALIPHIVRRPELTPDNLRPISTGTASTIKLNYSSPDQPDDKVAPAPAAAPAKPAAPVAGAAIPAPVPATPPAANVPTTTPALQPPATAPPLMPPATAPPDHSQTAAPAGSGRVRFSPAQVDTNAGNSFTVSLLLEGATDVTNAPLQIQFDPKVLQLNNVVRGDLMSSDGQQPLFTQNTRNDTGSATIQLNRLPGTPGVNGTGVLVTLNLQAVGKGTTAVSIPGVAIRNSQGQVVASGSPQLTVNVK